MRLRAILFAVSALGLAAGGAWQIGRAATTYAEHHAETELLAILGGADHTWASVEANGLIVVLKGQAPDEASRFHALELARAASGISRIVDRTEVAAARPAGAPAFALELLRGESGLSLIGLAPTASRTLIADALGKAGLDKTAIGMLETADHPAPAGWGSSLRFGLDLIAELPRAKVRVTPGAVVVTAVAEDEAARDALARRLRSEAPEEVDLALDLTAPRPVLTPYTFAFRKPVKGNALLVACSSETEANAASIIEAARAAGAKNAEECTLGLGAPSPDWAAAAIRGIAAVEAMNGGSFALNDMDAVLVGPPDMGAEQLSEIGAALDRDLPDIFTLATRSSAPAAQGAIAAKVPIPEFHAVLEDGMVRLAGPVADKSAQTAILGFAEAMFGHDNVESATVLDPNLPEGWPVRVLSAVEALGSLEEGQVAVTADHVTVSGRTLNKETERELAAFFARKDAGKVVLDVNYDAAAAAALAEAQRPPSEICAERIGTVLSDEMITFGSGSAEIAEESADVVAAIAGVLVECPGARFEIAGYTDAQGDAALNHELSERRAASVAEALKEAGAFLVALAPKGYGEDRPVADNETEDGRALNRRIEFSLLPEEGLAPDEAEPEAAEAEETEDAEVDGEE